jgi:hypothetical protein
VASLGDPRVRDFLAHGTRTGKLAYLAAGGNPLVAPVWFGARQLRYNRLIRITISIWARVTSISRRISAR